jgi:hypothetical protein
VVCQPIIPFVLFVWKNKKRGNTKMSENTIAYKNLFAGAITLLFILLLLWGALSSDPVKVLASLGGLAILKWESGKTKEG